jgi:hypothetical protein
MFNAIARRPSVFRPGVFGSPPGAAAAAVDTTTFLALAQDSGDARMPEALTINGITVAPFLSYRGAGAGAGVWTAAAGPSLALASTGTDPTTGRYTPATTLAERGVLFSATGKVFQAASAAEQLGLEDFFFEVIFRVTGTGGTLLSTRPTGGAGFSVQTNGATIGITISDGVTPSTVNDTGVTLGGWHIWHGAGDRSDNATTGGRHALQGVAIGSMNWFPTSGSLAGGAFTIASLVDFASKFSGEIASIRVWRRTDWFPGGATNTTMFNAAFKERAAMYMGVRASTALGSAVPATMTRSSAAYLDRIVDEATLERRLFLVGLNWLRIGRRAEAAGGELMSGYLPELQNTNLCLRSEELDNATWTKVAGTVSSGTVAAPTGDVVADGIVADATNGLHGVTQSITTSLGSATMSAWAKAGNQGWLMLECSTIPNTRAWFDVSTGVVGTKQASIQEALIEPYGNGWFRCSIRFGSTSAAHTFAVLPASADNVALYTGDAATVNTHVWGVQVEQNTAPSSYIATTTASATRTLDTLTYVGNDGNFVASSPGMLSADFLCIARDLQATIMLAAAAPTSAATTPDSARIEIVAGGDAAHAQLNRASAAEVDITGSTDVVDGERHTIAMTWATNEGKLLVDGAQQGSTDTSVTVLASAPALLTVGMFASGQAANALVGNVRLRQAVA